MKQLVFIITILLLSISGYSQNHYRLGKKVSKNDRSNLISLNNIKCNLAYIIVDKDIAYGLIINPTKRPCDDRLANNFINNIKKEYKIDSKKHYIVPGNKDIYSITKSTKKYHYIITYMKDKNNGINVGFSITARSKLKKVAKSKTK